MQRSLLALAILTAGTASATPFTGNDTRSNAMGNTGVASADSFAASQFNPALLSAYDDDVDFGLQLPSIRFAIDDGYGFIKAANVTDAFEDTDSAAIEAEINGGTGGVDLATAADNVTAAAAALNDGVDPGEVETLNSANATLNTKITNIQTEMDKLDIAITDTNESLSTLEDRPLAILGSIGTAIAIPRSGLGLALHLNTSANLGMRANIAQSDLDQISTIVTATSGYTDEAAELSQLSTNLSNAVTAFNQFDTSLNPCGGGSAEYETAFNNMVVAQAKLEAESTNTTVNTTNCAGAVSEGPTGGTTLVTYTDGNGVYVNGELQASATEGLGDDSSVTILGANIVELGISAAREFTYLGQTFSVGVTPKLQSLQIFEDTIAFDEAGSVDSSTFSQNTTTAFTGNLDIGIAKNWYNVAKGQVRAGLVVKDLIPQTFESASGRELEMGPKARIGVAHETRFSTLALDLDLTENEPLGYGVTTRYIGVGGEFDAFNWMKVRAGYRNNLSVEDSHVITTGLGFTPFGVGLDITAWLSPATEWEEIVQDAGLATQFSMNW
ncbi:conjugal transfer protein TraF [Saccharospirillum sp. HFRX-1]|uniref:conjugal transfer protein TraF n=1 Tax=unclassified Saccharospirillum TaxID=2633430 RepID=UPI003721B34F